MTDRVPSLNALRVLEAVARHLSLTKAANELHVTPAAISHQIKGLEADLGIPLVERSGRRLRMTEAAQAGLGDLRVAFDRLTQAARKIREHGRSETLTVSTTPSFAAGWLIPRLERFRARQPDIDLRLDTSVRLLNLEREGIDAAIRYGAGDYPGLETVRLFNEGVFPVCSPAVCAGAHPLNEPADLKWHTLLHLDWWHALPAAGATGASGDWPDWRMWLLAAGVEGVDHTRGPRFSDSGMALQAARLGQGVALGSTSLVGDDLRAGTLVVPFALSIATRFACFLVYPKDTAAQPKIAAFREWLLSETGVAAGGGADGEAKAS